MAALTAGKTAPNFTLPAVDGQSFSLADALQRGPVVLVFFKISCPVCQYALPFLERIYQAHRGKPITMIGVSQNDAAGTTAFMQQYGVTFPVLLDEAGRYPVSNAFGLTNVPTVFFIAPEGEIEISSVGWSRAEIEQLNSKLAEAAHTQPAPLFHAGEQVADFRPG